MNITLITKAITKRTKTLGHLNGNNLVIADFALQRMEALDTRLPPWLAHETAILAMLGHGEEEGCKGDSLGVTAPEAELKMRPDITTDTLVARRIGSRRSAKPIQRSFTQGHDRLTEEGT